MHAVRTILIAVLVLALLASSAVLESRVLCIEADGCITLEDASTGCCAATAASRVPSKASTPVEVGHSELGHDTCDSCTDILIATDSAPTSSPDTGATLAAPVLGSAVSLPLPPVCLPTGVLPATLARLSPQPERSTVRRC